MIGRIQGRSHRVYTGVAILTEDRESCFAVETRVDVYPMSDAEIEAYVDCGESMDKAVHTAFREVLPRISAESMVLTRM